MPVADAKLRGKCLSSGIILNVQCHSYLTVTDHRDPSMKWCKNLYYRENKPDTEQNAAGNSWLGPSCVRSVNFYVVYMVCCGLQSSLCINLPLSFSEILMNCRSDSIPNRHF